MLGLPWYCRVVDTDVHMLYNNYQKGLRERLKDEVMACSPPFSSSKLTFLNEGPTTQTKTQISHMHSSSYLELWLCHCAREIIIKISASSFPTKGIIVIQKK